MYVKYTATGLVTYPLLYNIFTVVCVCLKVFFVESICDDPEIILQNIKVSILCTAETFMYNVYSTEYRMFRRSNFLRIAVF